MVIENKIKMNLQLFSGLFGPDGPSTPNPLVGGDDNVGSQTDPGENIDSPIDNQSTDTGDNQDIIDNQSSDTGNTNIPGIDQNDNIPSMGNTGTDQPGFDIQTYLDGMMAKIDERLPQQQQEEHNEPTPEELEAKKEEMMNKFYEDPVKFFDEMQEQAEQKALEGIKPIQDKFEMQEKAVQMDRQLQEFATKNPDFQNYAGTMAAIIDQNPAIEQLPNALDVAYKMAKGEQTTQPQSFNDMLKDQNNLQSLLQNEEVKKMILSSHMNHIKDNQPPLIVGANGGGSTHVTAPNKPTSIKDAGKAWRATWQQ